MSTDGEWCKHPVTEKKKKKAQLELGRPIWATMIFPFILDSENKDQFNKMMSRIVAEGFQL
jgi:hypothetical protein